MTAELWIAIIAQTIIIVGAVLAAYVRQERRMTRLEGKVDHLETVESSRDDDMTRLENQVQGISRAVARLEGAHSTCPWIASQSMMPPVGRDPEDR